MRFLLTHTTTYQYTGSVSLSHHLLRLMPRELLHQRCRAHEVGVEPKPAVRRRHVDYFGNHVLFLTLEGRHSSLVITSKSEVSLSPPRIPPMAETPAWETVREASRGQQIGSALEASEFVHDSPLVAASAPLAAYASPSFPPERPMLEAVLDLTRRIHADFKFDPKATSVATPLEEVFKLRRGVCQDFAQLQIACLRSLGLPARYVSGYLETDPPPGQERLAGADASHAWVSFYCHGIGWLEVDPTNNLMPGTRHITVAFGRDYSDVSPIKGVILGSGDHSLEVSVDVLPVAEPVLQTPGEKTAREEMG